MAIDSRHECLHLVIEQRTETASDGKLYWGWRCQQCQCAFLPVKDLPCGHPAACFDGVCGWCEDVARYEAVVDAVDELLFGMCPDYPTGKVEDAIRALNHDNDVA